jgi:hypothetical protein
MVCSRHRFTSSRSSDDITSDPSRHFLSALRASFPTASRSCRRAFAGRNSSGTSSSSRWARRKSLGFSKTRRRVSEVPSRQALYRSPTSRLVRWSFAMDSDRTSQASPFARAIGTRYLIAAWAGIRPVRMCSCTGRGRSSTSDSLWETQLTLRSKRFAMSSWVSGRFRSTWSNHPCSIAVSRFAERMDLSRTRASVSLISHTVARTVSAPSRFRRRTRL